MDSSDSVSQLTAHLFRHESARLVAMLTASFGVRHLQLAEDVVQEAMARAVKTWPFHGIPNNPRAWLMRTAKNLALDTLRREQSFREKEPEIVKTLDRTVDSDAWHSPNEIPDDFLRLLFVCCHPELTADQQVTLALKVVCSFGHREIAKAFLTTEAAIAKRLTRARSALRHAGAAFSIPEGKEMIERLGVVLRVIYLVFTEGHHATQGDGLIRRDLCAEAIRLAALLARHPVTGRPETHALLALLCLHAARLPSRIDRLGCFVPLEMQGRSLWDRGLIQRGVRHLAQASGGACVSEYHCLAAISACHCLAADDASTDWPRILSLYDDLVCLKPSPVVLLNRAVAVAKVHGAEQALRSIEALAEGGVLEDYPFVHAVLGELEVRCQRPAAAVPHFERAMALSPSSPVRAVLAERLRECWPASTF